MLSNTHYDKNTVQTLHLLNLIIDKYNSEHLYVLLGGNENEMNIVQNNTIKKYKHKQQNVIIDQAKLQVFKVTYYIQYLGYNLP